MAATPPDDERTGTCPGVIHFLSTASSKTLCKAALWVFSVDCAGVLPSCLIRQASNSASLCWSMLVMYVRSKNGMWYFCRAHSWSLTVLAPRTLAGCCCMRSMASFATSLNALVWIAMPCSCLISHSARTLIAAVTALVFYLIFKTGLSVKLPAGILGW